MFSLVGLAEASASVIPITAALAVIVGSLQAAGGGFISIRCIWLGITWRRGTEHGMDEFSAIAIAAALIVGSTAIGAAVAGAAGAPLMGATGVSPINEVVGDLIGSLSYLATVLLPGGMLTRRWRRAA